MTLALSLFFGMFLIVSQAVAWQMNWQNSPLDRLMQEDGVTPVPIGSMVQLIADGGNGVIDDPMEWIMAQPDPCAALEDWIAQGCPPVGDDYIVPSGEAPNPLTVAGLDGYFLGRYISNTSIPAGTLMYTRFFSTPVVTPDVTYYGEIGHPTDPGQTFYVLQDSPFPDYTIYQKTNHAEACDTDAPESSRPTNLRPANAKHKRRSWAWAKPVDSA